MGENYDIFYTDINIHCDAIGSDFFKPFPSDSITLYNQTNIHTYRQTDLGTDQLIETVLFIYYKFLVYTHI